MKRIALIAAMIALAACTSTPPSSTPAYSGPANVPTADKEPVKLKPSYANKETFLADVQHEGGDYAVNLDGQMIRTGFGPAVRFLSQPNGMVIRDLSPVR